MEEPTEDSNKMDNEIVRNPDGTIKSGVLNPKGKKAGTKNFNTYLKEAIIQVAESNKVKPSQVEIDLVKKGVQMALKGNFLFWNALQDRQFGKVATVVSFEDEIESVEVKIIRTKDEIPNDSNSSLSKDD